MNRLGRRGVAAAICIAVALGIASPSAAGESDRVVIAGGDLTEIAFELGAGSRVVGVDSTSTWPPEATGLPQIGYVRRLSAEGILSLAPGLVLAAADAAPALALDQLRAAGVEVAVAPDADEIAEIPEKITFVGRALGLDDRAAALAAGFTADLAAIRSQVERLGDRPRVLFILSVQRGAPLVAGEDTTADRMITMAAGENAASGFEGYRPMSPEAIIAAAPDVILMMRQHADELGGIAEVLARPGIALTPAGRNGRAVTMDGTKLLGFGPRTPEAIAELARLLHPASAPAAGL